MVYCSIGFITNTSAGSTPANSAFAPSSRRMARRVPNVEGFFCVEVGLAVESVEGYEESSDRRAVMRVLTTQIGFVSRTVAEPAMRPASMDSRVVRFVPERRPDLRAAREKRERVHSYPSGAVAEALAVLK